MQYKGHRHESHAHETEQRCGPADTQCFIHLHDEERKSKRLEASVSHGNLTMSYVIGLTAKYRIKVHDDHAEAEYSEP